MALESSPQTGLSLPQQRFRTKALIAMPLTPTVEKQIRQAIIEGSFASGLDFEDVCTSLLKRDPQYKSLGSGKADPNSPAPGRRPDGYAYLDDENKWVYFEYTARARDALRSYVKELSTRKYYAERVGVIKGVVLVSSQPLPPGEIEEFGQLLSTELGCWCRVLDVNSLVAIFDRYAVDLVEPLLGIECHPKWFRTLEQAIEELYTRYSGFPTLEDFRDGSLQVDQAAVDTICEHFRSRNGPCLLTGRWGSGKTVLALTLGFKTKKEDDLTVYYLDMVDHTGRNSREVGSALIRSLQQFRHPRVLFILDNAHLFPGVSYFLARWAIRNNANVLVVSRPISEEMCDEDQFFPFLFKPDDAALPAIDAGIESATANDEADLPVALPPWFTIRSGPSTITRIVRWHCQKLGVNYECTESDSTALGEKVDYNLTLLALLLRDWDPTSCPIAEADMDGVYRTLAKRFTLETFPEVYLVAALNHFDCSADLNVLFQDPNRKSAFLAGFVSKGILRMRRNLVFGIGAGEARLIVEAGISRRELQDDEGRLLSSVQDVLKVLLVRYASGRPKNPYEMLRRIRWAAFEARQFEGLRREESAAELLGHVLNCSSFKDYLREIILPNRLSMLGLGNIARLYKYAGLSTDCYSNVLTRDAIRNGILNRDNYWTGQHPGQEPWFTWQEFFAWRHLENLNEQLGSYFLEQFEYAKLRSHGMASGRGLSHLLHMARRTDWLGKKVGEELPRFFGDPAIFQEKIRKLKEAGICFLIRDAALFSRASLDCLAECMPPKALAKVAKEKWAVTGDLFRAVSRYMGPGYMKDFTAEFAQEDIYNIVFGQGLVEIVSSFSDKLYERFVERDLAAQVAASSFHEIQLFLRNLSLFGFQDRHREWTARKFHDERLKEIVISKIAAANTSLVDIAFFLLDWAAFSPDVAADYCKAALGMNLSESISEATLSDLALFLLSVWMAGPFSPLDAINIETIHQKTTTSWARTPLRDLIEIAGVVALFELDVRIPRDSEELAQSLERHFARSVPIAPEELTGMQLNARIFRLALNLQGLTFLVGPKSREILSRQTDVPLLLELFTGLIGRIKKQSETSMTRALGRLPESAERKITLLRRACSCLSP
jgi:hypothetical protein